MQEKKQKEDGEYIAVLIQKLLGVPRTLFSKRVLGGV
jgi:hypothetical protein